MDVDTMLAVLDAYYQETPPYMQLLGHGRAAGGYLHIVVDDGNLEDGHIQYCIGDAREHGDRHAVLIGEELLSWSMEKREELYGRYQEYGF